MEFIKALRPYIWQVIFTHTLSSIMSKIVIQLHQLHHRGGQYLQIESPNTEAAKQYIRSIAGRKWSQTHCCWYVPWTQVSVCLLYTSPSPRDS